MNKMYYIRILADNSESFERYLIRLNIECCKIIEFGPHNNGILYFIRIDEESLLSLKLAFNIVGCLDFNKKEVTES